MDPSATDLRSRLARVLLEPHARLEDPARRSSAALFAACLLSLFVLFAAYDAHLFFTRPGYAPPWPGYLIIAAAYALCRFGYFYPSVLLTLAMLPMVSFMLVASGRSAAPVMTLTLPVLGVLLATLLVDAWTTAAFTVASAGLIATTALLPGPHQLSWETVSGPLLIVLLGGAIGVASIVHRTRLELERRRALESSAAELEHRVRERTLELAQSVAELETFSYSVSHDLRGPLRAIEGYAAILAEDYEKELGPGGLETVSVILESSARMSVLIDSLLELASVSRAPLTRQAVDLVPLAGEVIRELRALEPSREVQLVLPESPTALGDAPLLRTILQNLLANAWKFTAGVAHPSIELAREVRGERSYFVVRDNGAGFDMARADNLFRPFERLHAADEFPGTGIGLATVFRAVQRHGGDIFAEAEQGQGAAFFFQLGEPDAS